MASLRTSSLPRREPHKKGDLLNVPYQNWVNRAQGLGLKSPLELACVLALLASGLLHACLFWVMDRSWEDPLSFRKATLFGLSTGVTLWSCLWAMEKIQSKPFDPAIRNTLSLTLLLEVFLITLQTWRKEQSHFNHHGMVNGLIELAMLLLISIAVLAILQITYRAWKPHAIHSCSPAMRWAIRWGMLLLCISVFVGYLITWIGQYQALRGDSPTLYGARGVLKFPHGAALHAIQTLALVAWISERWRIPKGKAIIDALTLAHFSWLAYAMYQTFSGKDRFEFDAFSLLLILATALLSLASLRFWLARPGSTHS